MKYSIAIVATMFLIQEIIGQTTNDLINLLIQNKSITQDQADYLHEEATMLQQQTEATRISYYVSAARQIHLSGYSQIRYPFLMEKGKNEGFDLMRIRLDLKGYFTPWFSYRIQADLADKPKLINGYREIKLNDFVNITAVQFNVPFSLESLTTTNELELTDCSQAVEALVPRGKDVIGNQKGRDKYQSI